MLGIERCSARFGWSDVVGSGSEFDDDRLVVTMKSSPPHRSRTEAVSMVRGDRVGVVRVDLAPRSLCRTIVNPFVQKRCRSARSKEVIRFFSFTFGCSPLHAGVSDLRRHRFVDIRIFGCLKGTRTCRSFTNRSHRSGAKPNPPRRTRCTSHPQVAHNVALVLGGGGAAGTAWGSASSSAWPKRVSI